MAASATDVVLDVPATGLLAPGDRRRSYALSDVAGPDGTVIVFICNHCPYVKAVIDRLVADARALIAEGIGFAAISSNDAAAYRRNSLDRMKTFATAHAFPFPYLHDETRRSREPTAPSARPTSSATITRFGSSTAAASTRAARPLPAGRPARARRSHARDRRRPRARRADPVDGCWIKWDSGCRAPRQTARGSSGRGRGGRRRQGWRFARNVHASRVQWASLQRVVGGLVWRGSSGSPSSIAHCLMSRQSCG